MGYALSIVQSGDQIWAKKTTEPDLYGPMDLPAEVKVIGGFAGTEFAASASNPIANVTIIDGGGSATAVDSAAGSPATMLRGFTIRNGLAGDLGGGGVLVRAQSSAMFVQCVIENNRAGQFGAGVAIRDNRSPKFINCIFRNNGEDNGTDTLPYGGGAVYVHNGSPTFTNCLFYGNVAGDGAALALATGAPQFVNCTIAGNFARVGKGGGVFDQEGKVVLRNTILWENGSPTASPQIHNNRYSVTTASYCDIQGGWRGWTNLDDDPLFVDEEAGNYMLQNPASPCRCAGDNSFLPTDVADLDWDNNTTETIPQDVARNPRLAGVAVDMGAYELPKFLPNVPKCSLQNPE